jgi:hypothetical protein
MSDAASKRPKQRKRSVGQTIGGIIVGFEQQILRTTPPAEELVRHARPDEPVPASDGSRLLITMPDNLLPAVPADPGKEDEEPMP